MGHNCLSWLVDSAVHTDDQLMLEACICVQEETVEMALECLEKRFGYLVLDGGWQLLIEVELLDDKVEIINESVLNKFFDRVIQFVWNLLLTVTIFKS